MSCQCLPPSLTDLLMPTVELGWQDEDGTLRSDTLIRYGPSIRVLVTPYPGSSLTTPSLQSRQTELLTMALVDTGAEESCIDTQLAGQLGLLAIDTMPVSGAGGTSEHPVFMAYVHGVRFSYGVIFFNNCRLLFSANMVPGCSMRCRSGLTCRGRAATGWPGRRFAPRSCLIPSAVA